MKVKFIHFALRVHKETSLVSAEVDCHCTLKNDFLVLGALLLKLQSGAFAFMNAGFHKNL